MSIQLPVLLNDGSSLLMDADFEQRLKHGDATIGWTGDDRLGVYHVGNGIVAIKRLCEDGELRTIMQSRRRGAVLGTEALKFLAEHDSQSRRAYDARADMDAHNDAIRRDAERAAQAHTEQFADKFRWALRKDIGAHVGGSRHTLMTLPKAPWRKDA